MDPNKDELLAVCQEKWGGESDARIEAFFNNFDSWYAQIPPKNRQTVMTLIKNLDYYSHNSVNECLRKLHQKLLKCGGISIENTIYVFIKSKYGITNSSNDYWMEYRWINGLNKHTCIEDMTAISKKEWGYIDNIVFIDDFGGTGDSLKTELERNPEWYCDKNVFYITIDIMTKAIQRLEKYAKTQNIRLVFIPAFRHNEAFDRGLFPDKKKAMTEINEMSKEFSIPPKEIMGYKKTQALVAFYNNTPNNTLGFIRYNTDRYSSPFPRKDDEMPNWRKMQKDRIRRQKANYKNKLNEW